MQVLILRPGQVFFKAEAESISVPSAGGNFGILSGHCPLIRSFESGIIYIDKLRKFGVLFGLVKVQNDTVIILCESAITEDTIKNKDLKLLEKSKVEAQNLLEDSKKLSLKSQLAVKAKLIKSLLEVNFYKVCTNAAL